jgi:hypothetical protein
MSGPDEAGYLITGPDLMLNGNSTNKWPLDRSPYYLETNMPGLFAAGDRIFLTCQATSAVCALGAPMAGSVTLGLPVSRCPASCR